MRPDLGDRLRAVLRALEDVLIPAIPPEGKAAIEQARLCALSLRVIASQHDKAYPLAIAEVQLFAGLLAELQAAAGDALDPALAEQAQAATAFDWAAFRVPSQAELEETARDYRVLAAAIVDAATSSVDAALEDRIARVTIAHAARESQMRRTWMAASGVEPDPAALPEIDAVIASALRQSGPAGQTTAVSSTDRLPPAA